MFVYISLTIKYHHANSGNSVTQSYLSFFRRPCTLPVPLNFISRCIRLQAKWSLLHNKQCHRRHCFGVIVIEIVIYCSCIYKHLKRGKIEIRVCVDNQTLWTAGNTQYLYDSLKSSFIYNLLYSPYVPIHIKRQHKSILRTHTNRYEQTKCISNRFLKTNTQSLLQGNTRDGLLAWSFGLINLLYRTLTRTPNRC
mgnify:CR=1 FL=1